MAQRFYSEAGRIIFSKPGYDASPSLPDSFKIFDSNWNFGYVLIASGSLGLGQGTHVIGFPTQHFIPAVEVAAYESRGGRDYLSGASILSVSTSSFTIQIFDDDVYRVDYSVLGVSQ